MLVTIDCLRPDHLGLFGYSRKTSPYIDRMARSGIVFVNAFSHGGGTEEAFPTMLSGVPPPVNMLQCDQGIRRGSSIAHDLKRSGYATAAFNSNPYLSIYWGYSDGFDYFYHNLKAGVQRRHTVTDGGIASYLKLLAAIPPIIRGEELTKEALSWINSSTGPFFVWIHYMDAHMPYLPPSKFVKSVSEKPANRMYMPWLYRKMYKSNSKVYQTFDSDDSILTKKDIAKIVDYYDGGIRYVDSCIGNLFDGLEKRGRLSNTLVIITADHGELLGEHGLVDHGYLYEQIIHVPLIMVGAVNDAKAIDAPTTHLHVYKTIKSFTNQAESVDMINDENFADFNKGIISTVPNPEWNSYSCRTTDWHFIETHFVKTHKVLFELYDVKRDPYEKINVYENEQDLSKSFSARIAEFIRRQEGKAVTQVKTSLTSAEEKELSRRLKELGYE